MENIRKLLLAKKALPDGYGRSVVGGRELITPPSQKAESVVLKPSISEDQVITYKPIDLFDNKLTDLDYRAVTGNDYIPPSFDEFTEDSLMNQWNSLGGDDGQNRIANDMLLRDLEDVESGEYKSKYLKNGGKYSPDEEEESVRFLGNAVRYGRGK